MAEIKLESVSVEFFDPRFGLSGLRKSLMSPLVKRNRSTQPHPKQKFKALDNVSFEITAGESVGIMGGNGSGKTTLLRSLNGVYAPTSGLIHVRGTVASLMELSLGIDPDSTGLENVVLRGALLGWSRKEILAHLEEINEFSGLEKFMDFPVRTFSSGMQLRLAFAISTLRARDILLMDEWIAVGDEQFRKKAVSRLQELIEASQILVIASHSKGMLENLCSRGIVLEGGIVSFDGPIKDATRLYFGEQGQS